MILGTLIRIVYFLDLQVSERDFGFTVPMNLQGDVSFQGNPFCSQPAGRSNSQTRGPAGQAVMVPAIDSFPRQIPGAIFRSRPCRNRCS